jgi:hypothetical protein
MEFGLELTVVVPIRATGLGLGAGGSIHQHIERDTYDHRIWDVESTKILNVQIIDSTTFKHVVGLNPPETPITAHMYKTMNLPFYRLWREEGKDDGVAGTWGNLKGVAELSTQKTIRDGKRKTTNRAKTERWGLLPSGAWGKLRGNVNSLNEGEMIKESWFPEPGLTLPVVLLNVDDTLPKFRSIGVEESEDD